MLQVSQGAAEIEDLKTKLREVEMDLKLVMEGSAELGGQEEVTEEQTEERREEEEGSPGNLCRGEHPSSLCPTSLPAAAKQIYHGSFLYLLLNCQSKSFHQFLQDFEYEKGRQFLKGTYDVKFTFSFFYLYPNFHLGFYYF